MRLPALAVAFTVIAAQNSPAQMVATFAGNAQHTGNYLPAAQSLNQVLWSTSINLNNSGEFAHYGAPLMTAANTVVVPVSTANGGFQVQAFNGNTASGASPSPMYTLNTDYVLPDYEWVPVYQPVLAASPSGLRLYYAGVAGTVYYIDNPDAATPGSPVQEVFYGAANYAANPVAYVSTLFVNTPITADTNGDIFFGFRVQGTAPAPLNATQSGFARIDPTGNGTYVLVGTAASDSNIAWDSHNSAPAMSADQSTVYVVVKAPSSYSPYGYLLGLDATTLATKYKVFLTDPTNGGGAEILDDSTASPTVAPDGDVYFGVYSNNAENGSRGFLLHFSGDLTVEKTPGGFGWDYTPAIVPATMVPLYTGSSPYLIFAKYNNYFIGDGDGVNKVALLDPNATQIDPHSTANGLAEMREVLSVVGVSPDADFYNDNIYAVREWCINSGAVNPATHGIFFNSEDGHNYRWSMDSNSLDQVNTIGSGLGQPYVPNVIGPNGVVYAINGGTLFALGSLSGVGVSLISSTPDMRVVVTGQPLTFTVSVTNTGSSGVMPTGSVTFQDMTFSGLNPVTTTLASNLPLSGGQAIFTTSMLAVGSHYLTASYSGDSNFTAGGATLLQSVHNASTTTVSSSKNPSTAGKPVTLTATVAPAPAAFATPAMVAFFDGEAIIGQVSVTNGAASITTSALAAGSHTITASFFSDEVEASSSGSLIQEVQSGFGKLSPASLQFGVQPVGQTSAGLSIKLANDGSQTMTFGAPAVTVTGDFTQTNNCAGSLAPQATCTITVEFTPTKTGELHGKLSVNDDATDAPQTADLKGTGTDFTLSAAPADLRIKHAHAANSTITVAPVAGFSGDLALSCQTPQGSRLKCSMTPESVTVNGAAQTAGLSVSAARKTPDGRYDVTVNATSGSLSHSASVTVTVP